MKTALASPPFFLAAHVFKECGQFRHDMSDCQATLFIVTHHICLLPAEAEQPNKHKRSEQQLMRIITCCDGATN
jgi:hypothetical protein